MKKIVYIGVLFLALVATSCSKEEVVIANDDNNRAPEWNSNCIEKKSGSLGSNGSSDEGDTPVLNPTPVGEAPTVDITDPNNDPDGKKKKH